MKVRILVAVGMAFATCVTHAAPLGAPAAPRPRPPAAPTAPSAQPVTPPCDPRASADYVPGVDVKGRRVAPADITPQTDVQISTEVYAETTTRNPQVPSVGVVANLPGLAAPSCVTPPTTTVRK